MEGILEQMFMPEAGKHDRRADRTCDLLLVGPSWYSPGTRSLWRDQSSSEHVEIGQREGREQACGVLGQSPVAHLGKAPQALDHMKGVLAARPGAGTNPVDELVMLGERLVLAAATVDPVTDATDLCTLAVKLAPVRLIPEQLLLLPVQQLRQLGD